MLAKDGAGARRNRTWRALGAPDRRNLVALAAVAAAIRLILFIAYSPVLTSDSSSYLGLAHRLASWHLQGSSGTRTPGYPLVLLALGYSPRAAWVAQALLGVVATLLVYGLVRRLGGGTGMALAAGLLYALDLEVLAVEHMVLTETLTSFLLLLAAHGVVSITRGKPGRRRPLVYLGLVLALLCLVRPDQLAVALYLVVALAIALSAHARGRARARLATAARSAAWVLVMPLAVLAAWTAINRATIGVTSPSTVLGYDMIDHVGADVTVQRGPDRAITAAYVAARARAATTSNLSYAVLPELERVSHLGPARLSGRLLSIALGVIERDPLGYVSSSVQQWPRFWLAPNYAYQFATGRAGGAIRAIWNVQRVLLALVSAGFVVLLIVDLALRARRHAALLQLPSLILGGVAVVGMLIATFLAYGDTGRYGYVYFPIVLSIAAAGGQAAVRYRMAAVSSAPQGPGRARTSQSR